MNCIPQLNAANCSGSSAGRLKPRPPRLASFFAGKCATQHQTSLREERGLVAASIDALMREARNLCAWYIKRSDTTGFVKLNVCGADAGPWS